jgi:chromosome segregation ATPase
MITNAIPGDLAAAEAQMREETAAIRETIASRTEEARAELDEIQRQVNGLQARAKNISAAAGAENAADERRAADLEGRAGLVAEADRRRRLGEDARQLAADLTAERERLQAGLTEVDSRLAGMEAKRGHLAGQLDSAQEAADDDAMVSIRPRLDAASEALAVLSGQRERLAARIDAIGDGQDSGELYGALSTAKQHDAAATELIYRAFPDSPEARHATEVADAWETVSFHMRPGGLLGPPLPEQPQRQIVARS